MVVILNAFVRVQMNHFSENNMESGVYDYEELWFEQGGKCNTALGMFKDKIPSLISALEYLRERPRSTDH